MNLRKCTMPIVMQTSNSTPGRVKLLHFIVFFEQNKVSKYRSSDGVSAKDDETVPWRKKTWYTILLQVRIQSHDSTWGDGGLDRVIKWWTWHETNGWIEVFYSMRMCNTLAHFNFHNSLLQQQYLKHLFQGDEALLPRVARYSFWFTRVIKSCIYDRSSESSAECRAQVWRIDECPFTGLKIVEFDYWWWHIVVVYPVIMQ